MTDVTPAELRAARERLGLSVDALAADLNLTPAVVEAWEAGRVRAPRRIAQTLAFRTAVVRRSEALAASGLPECAELGRLSAALQVAMERREMNAATREAIDRVQAHAKSCALCREREAYADAHAPLPPMPRSVGLRALDAAVALPGRLPPTLRPPAGDAGTSRRAAFLGATALSAWAIVVFAYSSISGLAHGRPPSDFAHDLATLPAIIAGYFVGLYLAGALFDATRPVRHRFIGYVLRGGVGAGVVYGTIGVAVELSTTDGSVRSGAAMGLTIAVVGALAGAMLWTLDRLRGRLPPPAE